MIFPNQERHGAAELDINCTLIEANAEHVATARRLLRFIGAKIAV